MVTYELRIKQVASGRFGVTTEYLSNTMTFKLNGTRQVR